MAAPPQPPQQHPGGQVAWQMHPDAANSNKDFKRNYDMKEELGKGGFGTVKRCIYKDPDSILGTKKELAAKINNTPEKKREQTDEAIICRALSEYSPGTVGYEQPSRFIVNLFDSIVEGDIVYNMYELATGGDLSDEINRREFFTAIDAADAIRQILLGVDHIHNRGYIHRDLKPQNILIQSKDVLVYKVADFGLTKARAAGNLRAAHGRAGTPSYMPPEAYQQNLNLPVAHYDTDYDIWSCGVILYQLLAGYQPFWEDNQADMENKIMNYNFDFPSPEWDNLTEAQEMINHMLRPLSTILDKDNPPAGFRQTIAQLRGCRFHLLSNAVPIPQPMAVNVIDQFNARQQQKRDLLTQHWNTIQQQQGQAGQQPPPLGP